MDKVEKLFSWILLAVPGYPVTAFRLLLAPRRIFHRENDALTASPAAMVIISMFLAYYKRWVEGQVEPMVRPTQRRQYKLHLEKHVLPSIGSLPIAVLSARRILRLRGELPNPERPGGALSLKCVKNIIAGSLRVMCRDAREIDEVLEHDPFVGVRWPRIEVPGPDPFTSKERDRILSALARRPSRFRANSGVAHKRFHPPFHAFAHVLFWRGCVHRRRPASIGATLTSTDVSW